MVPTSARVNVLDNAIVKLHTALFLILIEERLRVLHVEPFYGHRFEDFKR